MFCTYNCDHGQNVVKGSHTLLLKHRSNSQGQNSTTVKIEPHLCCTLIDCRISVVNFSLQLRPNPDLVLSSTEEHNCHDDCQYLMHSTHDMHDKLTTELPAMMGGAKVIGTADCNHQQRISM